MPWFFLMELINPTNGNANSRAQANANAKAIDARIPRTRAYHKSLKEYNLKHNDYRRYIQFLVIVGPDPHVILFKPNDQEMIPGGALDATESELDGLKRLWRELFHAGSISDHQIDDEVQFKDVVGQWYRPDLSDELYPYRTKYVNSYKEHIKTYLVELKKPLQITYPHVFKNCIMIDLYDIYDKKDPVVSSIPLMLSRFCFTSD
ncbi:Cleavage and polyadenylation specificity factor subunit 5 [Cyberlindnera fabianii]|uniref:Cleavage and polyadenylation specificity factor subunit 5 n=1 Tax=Cyberlindnera fabianii TaxID=36022 RepID=A0A1V2KZ43_CYBFA|nr:Cleavage and polyadenylation specificity factor subunit 5 [Cyberlindnera fabianii]